MGPVNRNLSFAIASIVTTCSAANASTHWGSAGGWDVAEGEDYCGFSSEFEGPGDTELVVLLQLDGSIILSLSNYNWSIREDDKLDLSYHLNGKSYGGAKSIGTTTTGSKGFISSFGPEFVTDLAKSTYLHVYKGEAVVDKLSLAGSAAAVALTKQCLSHVRAVKAAAAREKARWAHIPNDPFAISGGTSDSPHLNFAALFGADDYPLEAQRKNEQGRVEFEVSVRPDGRVSQCKITASSGSAVLDAATCRIITARARYPQSAVEERHDAGSVAWRLEG